MPPSKPIFTINLPAWSSRRKILFRFVFLFVLFFITSLSFPHPYIPDLPSFIAPFFEQLIQWTGDQVFHIKGPWSHRIISDSTGTYIHLFILLVFASLGTIIWSFTDRTRNSYHRLAWWFRVLVSYYLAFFLLSYGLNKLFKWQFYLPEPNTLFTPLGETYRDILYWSTMGASRPYTIFLGSLEIIAGILLLFKRSRLLGSLLAFMILLNVVAVNFSFDISVKIFSCFLLFLSILVSAPDLKRLYVFFFTRDLPVISNWEPVYMTRRTKQLYIIVKTILLAWMFSSLMSVYVRTGNYNDDSAARPLFHGAYDVSLFIKNNDTLPPLITDGYRWKRVFIHRRGYFIIQDMQDRFRDYDLLTDTLHKQWFIKSDVKNEELLMDYKQISDSMLLLSSRPGNDSLKIQLRKIDLQKLPLLQKEFNWTVDEE